MPICRQIIENQKHVFLTTHNPLVLDGLDLSNDLIRLFAVERSRNGYTQIFPDPFPPVSVLPHKVILRLKLEILMLFLGMG